MAARVIIVPGAMPSRDRNGRALAGKLRFYQPTTSNPATVYTDASLTVAHPWPIASDSAGRWPAIWADDANTFDVAWSDAVFDNLIAAYSALSPAADATLASVAQSQAFSDAAAASAASALAAPSTAATSITNLAIPAPPALLVFHLAQGGKTFAKGQRAVAASAANPANQVSGLITDFTDPVMTLAVDTVSGAGAHADWVISLTGQGAVSSVAGLAGAITAAALKAAAALDQVQNLAVAGRTAIWIPAAAMVSRLTAGPVRGQVETATNKVQLNTLDFDPATRQFAQFALRMPKSWNEGNVTAVFEWSHAATATNFKTGWALQGVAISDNEAGDAAFGALQQVNDTGGVTDNLYASPETAAVVIAGAPAAEDVVVFQVLRVADDAVNDTLAINARLHGVTLFITTDAGIDA